MIHPSSSSSFWAQRYSCSSCLGCVSPSPPPRLIYHPNLFRGVDARTFVVIRCVKRDFYFLTQQTVGKKNLFSLNSIAFFEIDTVKIKVIEGLENLPLEHGASIM